MIPDSVAVLLLLLAIGCAYGWWETNRLLNLYRAYATKQGDRLMELCYPQLQRTSHPTDEVYDWKRDGL